jgi:hypothetical protein
MEEDFDGPRFDPEHVTHHGPRPGGDYFVTLKNQTRDLTLTPKGHRRLVRRLEELARGRMNPRPLRSHRRPG